MSTRNGTRRMGSKSKSGVSPLMSAFVAFIFGYLFATVFDFDSISTWVSDNILPNKAHKNTQSPQRSYAKRPSIKPKLEFYTLLTEGSNSAPKKTTPPQSIAMNTKAQPPVNLDVTKTLPLHEPLAPKNKLESQKLGQASVDKFIIQVGSFKVKSEADKMRAALVMKGLNASISEVNQQNISWYRVVVGPFSTKQDAQKLQSNLVKNERIAGMIKKVEA
jgi:cell division protein FtsN